MMTLEIRAQSDSSFREITRQHCDGGGLVLKLTGIWEGMLGTGYCSSHPNNMRTCAEAEGQIELGDLAGGDTCLVEQALKYVSLHSFPIRLQAISIKL